MLRSLLLGASAILGAWTLSGCGDMSQSRGPGTSPSHGAPTCSQTCQDYLVSSGLVDTVWFAYNQNVAGTPSGPVDRTAACPLGGTVHITGTASGSSDGTTSAHLIFDLEECLSSDSYYSLTFTGSVNMDGSFKSGTGEFTAVALSADRLTIKGTLDYVDELSIAESGALSAKQESSGDSDALTGRLSGRDFSSATAFKNPSESGGSGGAGNLGSSTTAGPGCPSPYDGTYIGMFAYEYQVEGDPPTTGSSSLSLTVELACVTVSAGSAVLTVAHAQVTDAYFGCQVGGCTPLTGSVAMLPADPPTSPSNPSQSGQGIMVLFPNGAVLGTENQAGALRVSLDGSVLSNSLADSSTTWTAVNANAASAFPGKSGLTMNRAPNWTLNKSAL